MSNGNYGDAAWDAGGLIVDVAATAIPYVPGGAAAALKAGRAANRAGDVASITSKVDEVVVGAGGNWNVIDEVIDPSVVKQAGDFDCVPACGEMLLRDRGVMNATQEMIKRASNIHTNPEALGKVLNTLDPNSTRVWQAGYVGGSETNPMAVIGALNNRGSWAAVFRQPGKNMGHMVIVDGFNDRGNVLIRDPWDGSMYKMDVDDFIKEWSGEAVFSQ